MELLFADLVIAIVMRVLFALALMLARFVFRCCRTMLVDHPGLLAVLVIASVREQWITWPSLAGWAPWICSVLFAFAVIRFFGEHPPKELRHQAARHVKDVQKMAAPVAAGREWIRERRLEGKPPPPLREEATP